MILDFLFRKSSTTRILTPQELDKYLRGLGGSAAGVNVTPERAMLYAAVFACVKVLAESVGQLPLHLYERRGDREKVKAIEHPLHRLLRLAPNSFQTAQEWSEWVVACLALRGNAYCQINRVRGRVFELVPIQPAAVTPKLVGGEVVYSISTSSGPETLPAREVLHLKLFPLDGLSGASPVQYAREAIGLGIATEEHGAGLFSRGASPGGVLESPKTLTKEAVERLRASWADRHGGSANSHRVAVLEDGLQWKAVTMPSKDAQFLETRKYQRSEIAGVFRVPPHMIGDLERATFSNIEHQSLDFVVHGLMPYLTRIEQRIALQLLTEEEQRTYFPKFNVAGLLRGDMQARSEFYTNMVSIGAMSPNEVRELEDLNQRDGGDIWLTPSNMLIDGAAPSPGGKGLSTPG